MLVTRYSKLVSKNYVIRFKIPKFMTALQRVLSSVQYYHL